MSNARAVRYRRLALADKVKGHAAIAHFGFEICGMQLPFMRFADTKPRFVANAAKRVIGCQGAPDALVHHGEAIVCEGLIVHWATLAKKPTLAQNLHG